MQAIYILISYIVYGFLVQTKNIDKLPWFRRNVYDNVEEFYVVVKEKVSREQQSSQEEIHRKIGKVSHQQSKNRNI